VSNDQDLITVFRSMDADAKEDAEVIMDLLTDAGIPATLRDDSAPGVPEGVFEVQVPARYSARADQVMAENPLPEESEKVDPSSDLDLETVFSSGAMPSSEVEALGVKTMLESNGIAAVLVGDSVLPYLAFEVRVARQEAAKARALIAEAEKIGPVAAEQAEAESESEP
jgi:hypothetical protein